MEKTFQIPVTRAEQWAMESDHFELKSPRTGKTMYLRPHRRKTEDGRILSDDERSLLIRTWRRAVTAYYNDKNPTVELTTAEMKVLKNIQGY